jgi:hypothetical protein
MLEQFQIEGQSSSEFLMTKNKYLANRNLKEA